MVRFEIDRATTENGRRAAARITRLSIATSKIVPYTET